MSSDRSLTVLGIPNYTLTATWPVDFFFARLIGFNNYPITHSATGAFYAQAEILTTSAAEHGHVRKASQFVYGLNACAEQGDPVSPRQIDGFIAEQRPGSIRRYLSLPDRRQRCLYPLQYPANRAV